MLFQIGQTAENYEPSIVWAAPASLRRMRGATSASRAFPKASVAPTRKQRSQGRAPLRRRAPTQTAEKSDGPPKRCTRLPNVAAAPLSIGAVGACAPSELRVHHHVYSTRIRSVIS